MLVLTRDVSRCAERPDWPDGEEVRVLNRDSPSAYTLPMVELLLGGHVKPVCSRSPITGHTTPCSHGSAAAPRQMRPGDTPPRRPLAWRGAAPGGHLACAPQDGAARAHIRRLVDINPYTGGSICSLMTGDSLGRYGNIMYTQTAGATIYRARFTTRRAWSYMYKVVS